MKMLLLVLGTHPKALAAGTVKLVGSDYNLMVGEVSMLLEDSSYHGGMSKALNPYGKGKACSRIVDYIKTI